MSSKSAKVILKTLKAEKDELAKTIANIEKTMSQDNSKGKKKDKKVQTKLDSAQKKLKSLLEQERILVKLEASSELVYR
jgi:hypothetical protein